MKHIPSISVLGLLMPFLLHAQKSKPRTEYDDANRSIPLSASFRTIPLGLQAGDREIREYLFKNISRLQNTQLKIKYETNSPGGRHFSYQQYHGNKAIYGGEIKVNLDRAGAIRSIFDNSVSVRNIVEQAFPDTVSAARTLSKQIRPLERCAFEQIYFPKNDTLYPALLAHIIQSSENSFDRVYDRDGRVLLSVQVSMNKHRQSQFAVDSSVSGFVFLPDPLTTAAVPYGPPYIDDNDNDVPELNAQRSSISATATYNNGMFSLENAYIKITDHSLPSIPPATSGTADFYFTRSESGFEDVNTWYHITTFQQHIQSLGFSNLANYQIHADPHGFNGQDNSNFNPSYTPPRLTFGEGGVDDAEDADVIIHEYAHAIAYSAAPGSNTGSERQCLDEANGDYFAASYSRFLNPYKWEQVFSWDGHNEYWAGRYAVSTKHYPDDITGDMYADADIWSSTMMQIWTDLGRDTTDRLLMESLYSYAPNISMAQAAWLLVQADSMLYAGVHYDIICQHLLNRGLVTTCEQVNCQPVANFSFSVNGNSVIFQNLSSDALTFFWDFGDNYSSSMIEATHTYFKSGTYTVQLKVSNQCGTDSIAKEVAIYPEEEHIQLLNSHNFAFFGSDAWIDFGKPVNASVCIFNVLGSLVFSGDFTQTKSIPLTNDKFKPGQYFVKITTDTKTKIYKLLKL